MSIVEILRAVLLNIKENKFRVFLTSLGIIVGSLTIIMVVGIGKGSQQAVEEQFRRLSAETIIVRANRRENRNAVLELEDADKLMENTKYLTGIAINSSSQTDVVCGTSTITSPVIGVNENYDEINYYEMYMGDFITDKEGEKREKVAVIGYNLAEEFFDEEVEDAMGQKIRINGRQYEIIGVLKQTGESAMMGGGADDSVFIPYIVFSKNVNTRAQPTFSIKADSVQVVEDAMGEIEDYLEEEKGTTEGYMIMDAGSRVESAKESARTMSALLIGVASIVLIVGGIGIMNVLFVSVKERTKEIGILKSIGASKRDILLEFLFESIMISIAGGTIGSLLSIMITPIMQYTDLSVVPSMEGILIGLFFSIVTGTFFGYYPAMKAAQLKPIDALNYE